MSVTNLRRNSYLMMLVGIFFLDSGCMMRNPLRTYHSRNLWTMSVEEKSSLQQRVDAYILEHSVLSEEIKDALNKKKIIRGMNKEQVSLLLGPPEKIISKKEDREVWWYDVRNTHCLFYLFPLGWPWLLIHPQDLFDCKERDEFYWKGDILKDLKSYRVEVL